MQAHALTQQTIHTSACTHIYTYTHACTHTYTHTHTHAHSHTRTHTGVHHEEFWHTDDDALLVVDKLNADQAYARKLAETGTTFAENYLVKDVMMVSLRRTTE